jgi:hypothetical protein
MPGLSPSRFFARMPHPEKPDQPIWYLDPDSAVSLPPDEWIEPAHSHGLPARPSGVSVPKLATLSAGKVEGISGVQIGPGATELTRMPSSASCWASG